MGNDCSERICPFGKAHVDGYKGSLNGDGDLADTVVTQMYPKGTKEAPVLGTAQSGHEYRECSNKGICDRETGVCSCFDAYEGSACQRASCPNECSGHGVCNTVRELALGDYSNSYELWDADKGLACKCDAGYSGYDCSERSCPVGVDPLYFDSVDAVDVTYPNWAFIFKANTGEVPAGTVRFRFYDAAGEDWLTDPVTLTSGTLAVDVQNAFLNLPNNVVAPTTVTCTTTLMSADFTGTQAAAPAKTLSILPSATTDTKYVACKFAGNPGALRKPDIVTVDRASRSTAMSGSTGTADAPLLSAYVVDLGTVGSSMDYFGKKCAATLTTVTSTAFDDAVQYPYSVMKSITVLPALTGDALLQACLGDADDTPQAFGSAWDFGNSVNDLITTVPSLFPGEYPHLVKLVSTTVAGNSFNAIVYNTGSATVAGAWRIMTHVPDDIYEVYATDGTLARTFKDSSGVTVFDLHRGTTGTLGDTMAAVTTVAYSNVVTANEDISCKSTTSTYLHCIEKGSLVVIPSTLLHGLATKGYTGGVGGKAQVAAGTAAADLLEITTTSAGLYEVKSITSPTTGGSVITLDRPVLFGTATGTLRVAPAPIFKFTPAGLNKGSYVYAGECSTRGVCNRETGICKCFKGYTNDNCNTQSALAM
jgi:EGF-like domain